MQQVTKVIGIFFYEKENLPSKKKDTLLTSCIQKCFGARKFR
jgi:hypothetical protein